MTPSPETKRPICLLILMLLALSVSASNGLRLCESVFFWKTLKEYGVYPLFISISGGVWLIIGLFLVWGLWGGKVWGRIAAICGTAGYTTWYWLDRLLIQKPHTNLLFTLITSIILLFILLSILFSQRTKRFFQREPYGRKPETPISS